MDKRAQKLGGAMGGMGDKRAEKLGEEWVVGGGKGAQAVMGGKRTPKIGEHGCPNSQGGLMYPKVKGDEGAQTVRGTRIPKG